MAAEPTFSRSSLADRGHRVGLRHRPRAADRLVPGRGLRRGQGDRHAVGRPADRLRAGLRARRDRRALQRLEVPHAARRGAHGRPADPRQHRLEVIWTAIPRSCSWRCAPTPTSSCATSRRPTAARDERPRRRRAVHLDVPLPGRAAARRSRRTSSTCRWTRRSSSTSSPRTCIHDFWVPAFREKIDAVPGITTQLPGHPEPRAATYPVVCAELCGLGHSAMRQTAHVVSPDEFEQWLEEQARRGRRRWRRRRRRRRGGAGRRRRARRQDALRERLTARLRLLPHAGRRRHRRDDRPGPRRGPQGQGRRLHPGVDREAGGRRRTGLPGWDHAHQLRRHPLAGGDQGADRLPCRGRVKVRIGG